MNVEARNTDLRHELLKQGFDQPLGSTALVKTLLDGFVKATNNFEKLQRENEKLLKEKVAWDLSVEPYKCDNSRLLADCNRLHLELIRHSEEARLKALESRRTVRKLEIDNQCLEKQCSELADQIREMFASGSQSRKEARKPFVSTVRPKSATAANEPNTKRLASLTVAGSRCLKCSCSCAKEVKGNPAQRLRNDVQSQGDFISELRSQIDSRDREIVRLNSMLSGGRPAAALGKDCCYRGVGTLSQDVITLQKQKVALQADLKEAVDQQHKVKQREMALAQRYRVLEQELRKLEDVALHIEETANEKLRVKDEEMECLKAQYITSISNTQASRDLENDAIQNRARISRSKEKIANLQTELERVLKHDKEMTDLNQKLFGKYSLLKAKFKAQTNDVQQLTDNQQPIKEDTATSSLPVKNDDLRNIYKSERDYYQTEYLKLLNQPNNSIEMHTLREELRFCNEQLNEMQRAKSNEAPDHTRSVQSLINRTEREKAVLQTDLDRVRSEANVLHDRWLEASEALRNERDRATAQHEEWQQLRRRLEVECNSFANQHNLEMPLRKKLHEMEALNRQLEIELVQLQTSYQQLKTLQDQTEHAMVHQQSMLTQTENQLGSTTSRLSIADSSRKEFQQQISDLHNEITTLRSTQIATEFEKDQILSELDLKTEKLFNAETELEQMRSKTDDQQHRIDSLQRQLGATTVDMQQKEGTLRQTSSETDSLRHQIAQLVRNHENAMAENRRLESTLADQTADHEATRKSLVACEKEVNRLKKQLQQYVHEVQKAEELLMSKEAERDEMLNHFKSLSKDAVQLEDNNVSLEQMACDARRELSEAEMKIEHIHGQLRERGEENERLDRQVTELSRQVALTTSQLEHCMAVQQTLQSDLDATKDLCDRLEDEKIKVKAELEECSDIRRKLERDNEQLRSEMRSVKSGDKATVDNVHQLLTVARLDLDQKRKELSQKNTELDRLRAKLEETQSLLADNRADAARNDALAKEYSLQIKELRQQLTDKRFDKISKRKDATQTDDDRHTIVNKEFVNKESHSNTSQSKGIGGILVTKTTSHRTSSHTSISDSVSTDTSQLNRISRHLAPCASQHSATKSKPNLNENGLYFRPNASPLSASSFTLVLPEQGQPNETFQIDSRLHVSKHVKANGNDTPKSNQEVLEIAQLHDRFRRQEQQSSEEDIIAMETFVDGSCLSSDPDDGDTASKYAHRAQISEPNYRCTSDRSFEGFIVEPSLNYASLQSKKESFPTKPLLGAKDDKVPTENNVFEIISNNRPAMQSSITIESNRPVESKTQDTTIVVPEKNLKPLDYKQDFNVKLHSQKSQHSLEYSGRIGSEKNLSTDRPKSKLRIQMPSRSSSLIDNSTSPQSHILLSKSQINSFSRQIVENIIESKSLTNTTSHLEAGHESRKTDKVNASSTKKPIDKILSVGSRISLQPSSAKSQELPSKELKLDSKSNLNSQGARRIHSTTSKDTNTKTPTSTDRKVISSQISNSKPNETQRTTNATSVNSPLTTNQHAESRSISVSVGENRPKSKQRTELGPEMASKKLSKSSTYLQFDQNPKTFTDKRPSDSTLLVIAGPKVSSSPETVVSSNVLSHVHRLSNDFRANKPQQDLKNPSLDQVHPETRSNITAEHLNALNRIGDYPNSRNDASNGAPSGVPCAANQAPQQRDSSSLPQLVENNQSTIVQPINLPTSNQNSTSSLDSFYSAIWHSRNPSQQSIRQTLVDAARSPKLSTCTYRTRPITIDTSRLRPPPPLPAFRRCAMKPSPRIQIRVKTAPDAELCFAQVSTEQCVRRDL